MASDYDEGAATAKTGTSPSTAVEDLPLAPYPPGLPYPALHPIWRARDVFDFRDQALSRHDVVRVRMTLTEDVYNVAGPDNLKRIFLTERDSFAKTEDFTIPFGEGLLTVEGEEWRQQKDILQPLFRRDSVMDYADGMVEQIKRRADSWQDGDRFDLQREMTDMTLDVLFATVLGRELELDGDEGIREAAGDLNEWFRPTSYLLPNAVPTPARRRFYSAKGTLKSEAQRLLDEKSGNAPTDLSEADDLLSLLVGLRESGMADTGMLTDERLRDQMVTMIFAGHDTTTGSLTFAFWLLANHPEVRERFQAEVDELDGPPTLEDLDDLTVTDRIVTETLRLFPPVYGLPRRATTDVAFDGFRIPEGARMMAAIRETQRDDRFYDAPTKFRPSRWEGDLKRELPDFAYCPFGGGPRICIGNQFALLEAKLTLATIGRQYDLYWLGEGTEPPTAPEMTTRMPPGEEFLAVER